MSLWRQDNDGMGPSSRCGSGWKNKDGGKDRKGGLTMGLGFSHCDSYWSYSGFHRFRRRLASEIGVALDAMDGFRGIDEVLEEIEREIAKEKGLTVTVRTEGFKGSTG